MKIVVSGSVEVALPDGIRFFSSRFYGPDLGPGIDDAFKIQMKFGLYEKKSARIISVDQQRSRPEDSSRRCLDFHPDATSWPVCQINPGRLCFVKRKPDAMTVGPRIFDDKFEDCLFAGKYRFGSGGYNRDAGNIL